MARQKRTFSETENNENVTTVDQQETEQTTDPQTSEIPDEMEKTVKVETETTDKKSTANKEPQQVIVKKGGAGLAFLALLVALGVGGAGYYFGQQQLDEIQQKLTALQNVSATASESGQIAIEMPNFDQERAQIEQLAKDYQAAQKQIGLLEQDLASKTSDVNNLQAQINKLNANTKTDSNDWLLSEADFLLNNALRKLVLDNDIDTTISLLKLADETLEKTGNAKVAAVRTAINNDLKHLLAVNNVDQNAIMQHLSQLANSLDELTVLNVNFEEQAQNDTPTDSLEDWQANVEKSATSFLNHFIRVTPRGEAADKGLLAPNQDIYLRENIRLRLQIAILAVPRQQDDLYKQSLEAVSSWIRSYFDTNSTETQNFLKSVDELLDQSIYVDAPDQLTSLNALDSLLNRQTVEMKKVEINVDKGLTEATEAKQEEVNPKVIKPEAAAEKSAVENKENSEPSAEPNVEQLQEPQQ
ncbi:uroporphyrin-3 C-methyltransferase [Cricetibacter osteomyelitidis]|uniref:Uroporphyrin-3 C-methyltransferase n=2 Tax=Cricetibacter osteomyelitidis TaxID=1521931 RepID=A0A4R2T1Q4_9PAST|nr:uroporphyrinogen-III C-methyltransferase [Cricetibacter osteomyelitidis]TCP96837.1 uroporphyrin-3 C-methyltransferase [Cricetibacter osteomyelitidis]